MHLYFDKSQFFHLVCPALKCCWPEGELVLNAEFAPPKIFNNDVWPIPHYPKTTSFAPVRCFDLNSAETIWQFWSWIRDWNAHGSLSAQTNPDTEYAGPAPSVIGLAASASRIPMTTQTPSHPQNRCEIHCGLKRRGNQATAKLYHSQILEFRSVAEEVRAFGSKRSWDEVTRVAIKSRPLVRQAQGNNSGRNQSLTGACMRLGLESLCVSHKDINRRSVSKSGQDELGIVNRNNRKIWWAWIGNSQWEWSQIFTRLYWSARNVHMIRMDWRDYAISIVLIPQ
jgi:hypothetical protein